MSIDDKDLFDWILYDVITIIESLGIISYTPNLKLDEVYDIYKDKY